MDQPQNQYLLLMRGTDWETGLSMQEAQDGLEMFFAWVEELKGEGHLHGGQPLHFQGTVVAANATGTVADGPFMESKEAVGGYLLVTAGSLEQAVSFAHRCPVLKHGLTIEVRPVAMHCHIVDQVEAYKASV